MTTRNRWIMSDRRTLAALGLLVIGLFLISCGLGITSYSIGGLGVAIGVLGPAIVVLWGLREATRGYAYGVAEVHDVSPPPATGNPNSCDLHLVVHAQGADKIDVRVRDFTVPLDKWPEIGTLLPVVIPRGNPRRAKVIWEQVEPGAVLDDDTNPLDTDRPTDFEGLPLAAPDSGTALSGGGEEDEGEEDEGEDEDEGQTVSAAVDAEAHDFEVPSQREAPPQRAAPSPQDETPRGEEPGQDDESARREAPLQPAQPAPPTGQVQHSQIPAARRPGSSPGPPVPERPRFLELVVSPTPRTTPAPGQPGSRPAPPEDRETETTTDI